jgi:hypothetical protein
LAAACGFAHLFSAVSGVLATMGEHRHRVSAGLGSPPVSKECPVNATPWSAAALAAGLSLTAALAAAPAGLAAQTRASQHASATTPADARLARFYGQRVRWHRCQRGPHDSGGKALDQAGARCADIRVPLDYKHPARRTITIAISRLTADPSTKKIGAMIINLGGPATPVLTDVLLARQAMGATGARFDLIGMNQRFAGRSTPLNCHWNAGWLPRGAGRSKASAAVAAYLDAERPSGADSDRVFLVLKGPRRGLPLSVKGMDEILAAARHRAGLGHATCHELRHTCLTQLGGRDGAGGGAGPGRACVDRVDPDLPASG